jgi:ubiquinone biosynthesis protein UbiJ
VNHDGAAAIAKLLLNLFGLATLDASCLVVRVLGEAAAKLVARTVNERNDVAASEISENFYDTYRQQTLALQQSANRAAIKP